MTQYFLSLFAAFALAATSFSQTPGGLLEDAKRRQEIANQQAEADVQATLRQARSAVISSNEAVSLLRKALERIEQNPDLSTDRQAKMVRSLKEAIRLRETPSRTGADETPRSVRSRRAEEEKAAEAERDKLRAQFDETKRRLDGGRGTDTSLEERTREELGKGMARSSLPAKGDVEFDKQRWKDLDKIRGKESALTKKEKALLEALNRPMTVEWRNVNFRDVVEYLATAAGQPIILDKQALTDQNVNEETTTVNFVSPKPISMRTALRKVLADQGLAYVIKDESIYVTTAAKAREMMTTRTYYIGDLVNSVPNPTFYTPLALAKAKADTAKAIVDMIKESIDPMSWLGNGGSATITYSPIGDAIVVRQSAEVHMMLRSGLK